MKSIRALKQSLKAKSRNVRTKLGMYEPPSARLGKEAGIKADIQRGISVVERLLSCRDEEFFSKAYLLDALLTFGLSNQTSDWQHLAQFKGAQNYTKFGTLQYPTEFIDYLMDCAQHQPNTVCEIGVYTGGSAYFAAAVLQRANPKMRYCMIDIKDQLIGFDEFSELFNLDKRVPSTARDFKGEVFEMVFIDADHSYEGASLDYEALGRYAGKLIGFHDIHAHEYDHLNGGIVKFWSEIKLQHANTDRVVEYAHSPDRWMGIGLIDRTFSSGN